MAFHYFEEGVRGNLSDKRKLSAFLKQKIAFYLSVEKIDINYVFCTDDYLLEKNATFLQHDTFTDIITFDLSEKENELRAEIYISTERVKENAEKFKTPYQDELHRVIFHGMLHLCGFKDKTKEDAAEMRTREQECLHRYFNHE